MAADLLERLAAQAIRLGADALEIEYKDGREWVFAASGPVGFGITSFQSSSRNAARIREAGYRLSEPRSSHRITVDGCGYQLRGAVYDSFGEDAFHITLRRLPNAGSGRRPKVQRTPSKQART
jgi:hypothetical protein